MCYMSLCMDAILDDYLIFSLAVCIVVILVVLGSGNL
jgi:hypothetical protein